MFRFSQTLLSIFLFRKLRVLSQIWSFIFGGSFRPMALFRPSIIAQVGNLMISLALLSKTYPTENFPYQRALVWLFTMSFSSGLVVDDVRVLLDGLGCQASLSSLPRKGWQLNPSETCSHFPYDKVLVLPCVALDKAQPLAIGLREHSSIKNG